jgi:multidrug efflux pump subunit AcrB
MSYLPVTLIIVLTSSLFVALVLNPVFASQFMKLEDVREKKNFRKYFIVTGVLAVGGIISYISGSILWGNLLTLPLLITTLNKFVLKPSAIWFQFKFLPLLENIYEATLRKSLGRRTSKVLLFSSIGLFLFSVFFFTAMKPNVYFFPENEPRTIYVTMELPLGTDIEVTDEVTKNAEDILYSTLEPYIDIVKSVGVNVGNGKGGLFESGRSPNKSLTTITFVDFQYRKGHSTRDIMGKLSDAFKGFVGAKVFIEKEQNGPPVGKPINIEVGGDDYERLIALTEDIKQTINDDHILGIENLELDLNTSKPEMQLFINRDKVRRMGLSTQQVAMALRTSLYGKEISKYKDGEDEYDIMLRLKDKYRYDVSTLMNQKMKVDKKGVISLIPISAVASYEYASTYEKIIRIDNTRVITLSSNVVEG